MMHTKIRNRVIACACLLAIALQLPIKQLHAQAVSIASVTGRVLDPQGAAIGGAQIKMTAVNTQAVRLTTTGKDGLYNLPNLPIGAYTLEATAAGFQTYVQTGIVLRVNDSVQINVNLTVGSVSQRVEVNADATMVQTQQNTISQVIDERRIVDLPLNGRDPTQLIKISGAAVDAPGGDNTGSKSFFSSHTISVAGGQGNGTNYLLDGGDNNDTFTNVNMPFPFPDALQEFSVETSSLPARNGLHPGGLVNMVTKSGSNHWHGTLFEFIRNGDVNAISYFAKKTDGLKRNQFGGTFGGKLITDKLFFFGGYQGSRIRQSPNGSTAYVPTAAALQGDFSTLDGAGCQSSGKARIIKDPATGQPLVNDYIDPSRFDKASLALMKYLPQTTDPCGRVLYGFPLSSNESQYVGRVDWNINTKHLLYGRYFLDNYDLTAFFDPTNILVTGTAGNSERAQSFVLGDTYSFGPSTVNSFHGTFERRRDNRGPNVNQINVGKLGVSNFYIAVPDDIRIAVTNGGFNVGCGTCSPGHFNTNTFQFADDVDMLRGKHQIAFGVDMIRTQANVLVGYLQNGSFTFNGQYSNDPLLDFLTGTLQSFSQSRPQEVAMRETIPGLYVQDTMHVNRKLVMNIGLRWEPMLFPQDYFHRGSTFSIDAFKAGVQSSVYTNAPPGSLFYGDPGVTKSFTHDKLANFSPRLGFVFDPRGDGMTTFRVGGAILYDSAETFLSQRLTSNPPVVDEIDNVSGPYQFSNPWGNISGGNPFPVPFPPSKDVAFPKAALYIVLPPHIQPTSVAQWNASFQHQFGADWVFSLSYLGNKTSHLWVGQNINPAVYIPGTCAGKPCSSTSNTQSRRVLTLANAAGGAYYGNIVQVYDGANANYNGMLASVEHRFAHNYTFLANYTWSHCLDYADNQGDVTGGVFQIPDNPRGDYGNCGFDSPNIFNTSLVTTSEFGHGGWTSRILSNWQFAPLMRFTSGLPVNPASGKDNSLTAEGHDRPNVASSVIYTNAGRTAKHYQYLNPKLFTANPAGTFGNARHNSLRAPHYVDIDAALSRNFHLHESLMLNTRFEAFNVLNHPNFNGPNASIASSSFGQITSAPGDSERILQGAVKIIF